MDVIRLLPSAVDRGTKEGVSTTRGLLGPKATGGPDSGFMVERVPNDPFTGPPTTRGGVDGSPAATPINALEGGVPTAHGLPPVLWRVPVAIVPADLDVHVENASTEIAQCLAGY